MEHSDAAKRALARLRDPDDPAIRELARLIAEQTRDVPLDELVPTDELARQWADGLRALAEDERLPSWILERIEATVRAAEAEPRTVRDVLPVGVPAGLVAGLGPSVTPSEDLVHRLINQPTVHQLVGHVLQDALRAIGRRLGTEGNGSPPAWRGLLRQVRDNLGGVAGQIVDVVREEVDGVLDGRVRSAVTSATDGAVRTMARWLADPQHAEAFAEMRVAVAREVLDTPVADLVGPVRDSGLESTVARIVTELRALAADPDLAERVHNDLRRGLAAADGRSLGDWLDDLDLGEPYLDLVTDLVLPTLRATIATDAFAMFWQRLHA